MSVKMAVTDGASWASCRKVVVLRPMGNIRPPLVHHHPLAPADLPPVPDPRHDRGPELGGPGLELIEHRHARSGPRRRGRAAAAAVGLMKASRPIPSTVSTPERMFRRMSSASSRTRLSSVARVSCSIPASRRRWPRTATIAKTTLNTTIWAQNAVSGAPAWVKKRVAQEQRRRRERR